MYSHLYHLVISSSIKCQFVTAVNLTPCSKVQLEIVCLALIYIVLFVVDLY